MAKEQFIREVKAKLAIIVDADAAERIIEMIALELKDYDLAKRSTALTLYDDGNQKVVKSFLGCLIVEGKSKGTIEQYSYSLKRFFAFVGNRKYSEITTADIMACTDEVVWSKKHFGAKSEVEHFAFLHMALQQQDD